MRGSSQRIQTVGGILVLAACAVVLLLGGTMLVHHSTWLERSYRNRWAFRDVPTRRGAICDRDGRLLVHDQARFAVDVDYDAFRRGHPVGAAIAGAALLWPGEFGHSRAEDAALACARLVDLPCQAVSDRAMGRERARDLRFYLTIVVSGLTDRSRWEVSLALRDGIAALAEGSVAEVLHVSPSELAAAQRARAERLQELQATLRREAAGLDLGRFLDDSLERHTRTRRPLASRALARALPFATAVDLALHREAWQGFVLRPAVLRVIDESAAGLVSLPWVLGQVTAAGTEEGDVGRIGALAQSLVAEAQLDDALPDDLDLPDQAFERLTTRAQTFVRHRVTLGGRFGRSGVEAAMEPVLAGLPGLRFVERDATAREQLLYHALDVDPGDDVRLTIDARLQAVLERVLDAHARGQDTALVVIDARTGEVLAVGGRPLQIAGPDGTLVDRAVSPAVSWRNAGYLGSLVKPFVLLEQLAAEREGRPHTPRAQFIACACRYKQIPGTARWLACDEHHGEEGRDPVAAIAKSCNVFFFQAAEGLGLEALSRAYGRAGLCAPPGAGDGASFQRALRGAPGFARPRLDTRGHAVQHVAIGYGVKANALSVARAYAALATGYLPELRIIAGDTRPPLDLGIPPSDLALVHEGLRQCVEVGTARAIDGLRERGVHGKTGTAEVNEDNENNAWFAGFVRAPNGRATLAFAAVAYTVDDHGKESARMVGEFLRGIETAASGDELRRRWLLGEVDR